MLQVRVLPDLDFKEPGMKKIKLFFEETVAELKKVVWPSREQVADSTKVVLVSVLAFAVFFGIVDFLVVKGLDVIF